MLRSLRLVSMLSLAAIAALATACRDSGGDDTAIDATGPDSTTTGLTIQEIQSDAVVPGTPVDLRGKVVVAIDNFGDRKGNIFIAEEGGGEFSGVLVFGAPADQVAQLAIGDKIDVVGAEKVEFALAADTSGRTTTELQAPQGGALTVTKVGTGTVPAPHVIDALALEQMDQAARDVELEKWEGVLVRVNNVTALNSPRQITSSEQDDCTFRDFPINASIFVDSSLAAIPATLPMTAECPASTETNLVNARDCLASVTGIGDYFFNWKILPRETSAIETGGTGCPAPQDTTISDVQTGVVVDGAPVSLNDVVVTGRTFNNRSVWVSDDPQAAPNTGILVFRTAGQGMLPAEIDVGATVDVVGVVDEFNNDATGSSVTEIAGSPSVTLVVGSTAVPVPVSGVSVATLMSDTTGEPYEGVLIRLTNVRVTGPLDATSGTRPMSDGTTTFVADDDMHRLTEADNTCYTSITGVWHYNVFDNRWVFAPRQGASDRTVGTGCL